jgi:hypothetical protein
MVVAYIRPDKYFDAAHDQLQLINSYAVQNNLIIDDEFIDQTSQNKRLQIVIMLQVTFKVKRVKLF